MNVYFACSISGGREFVSTYQGIIAALMEDGHEIPALQPNSDCEGHHNYFMTFSGG